MKLYAKIFNYLEHKTTRTLALLLLQCLYLLFSLEMYPTSTKFIFLSLETALKLKSLILKSPLYYFNKSYSRQNSKSLL